MTPESERSSWSACGYFHPDLFEFSPVTFRLAFFRRSHTSGQLLFFVRQRPAKPSAPFSFRPFLSLLNRRTCPPPQAQSFNRPLFERYYFCMAAFACVRSKALVPFPRQGRYKMLTPLGFPWCHVLKPIIMRVPQPPYITLAHYLIRLLLSRCPSLPEVQPSQGFQLRFFFPLFIPFFLPELPLHFPRCFLLFRTFFSPILIKARVISLSNQR